jgi:hypothetical protein
MPYRATARPRFRLSTSPPTIDAAASDISSALGKWLQPAESEALSRNGSSSACDRDAMTANSH